MDLLIMPRGYAADAKAAKTVTASMQVHGQHLMRATQRLNEP